jgi:hypothetical protein
MSVDEPKSAINWDLQASVAIYVFMNLLLWSLWFFAGMGTLWPLAWTVGAPLLLGAYRLFKQ